MCVLYTIGYEGRSIDNFIEVLRNRNIKRIIDVRELPISRKKGFSKTSLQSALCKNKIDYIHIRELGSPKPIRDSLHENWDYDTFFSSYKKCLSSELDSVNHAIEIAEMGDGCLLCFESDSNKCHRKPLSILMKRYSQEIDRIENL